MAGQPGERYYRGRQWRRGYTTGACAAAAAKGAVLLLAGQATIGQASIRLPAGQEAALPLVRQEWSADSALCGVIKDGGDDPDATHGLEIQAKVRWLEQEGSIVLLGGTGVGQVTRPGLAVTPGKPAINPVPQQMIRSAVSDVLPPGRGVEVTVLVPGGEQAAMRTMNSQLGIIGGISILGTTGIVEPMSEEHWKHSLVPQLSIARAEDRRLIVLCPGQMGRRSATRAGVPPTAVALCSNFVGFMLEECVRLQFKQVLLWGHLGKLVKVAAGVFHTHSRVADARRETVAAHLASRGAAPELVREVMEAPTLEAVVAMLNDQGWNHLWQGLAAAASRRAELYLHNQLEVGTVLTNLVGEALGADDRACRWGEEAGWSIPLQL